MTDSERMRSAGRDEALGLLGSVSNGRVVFTERALPAVSLVRHVVDDGDVVVRVAPGAVVLRAAGQVVAYQADHVGACSRLRWSVVVIGVAEVVGDHVIRIRPELVTGQILDVTPAGGALPATA